MKTIGIHRRLDNLNRLTIPKEIVNMLEMNEHQLMEIFVVNGNMIVLKKAETKHERKMKISEKLSQIEDIALQTISHEDFLKLKNLHNKIKGGLNNYE